MLHVLLERVLRSEYLALEGLRLQAQVHQGLLGGDVELVQTAEKRAYQRAEDLLAQLLATAIPSPFMPVPTSPGVPGSY